MSRRTGLIAGVVAATAVVLVVGIVLAAGGSADEPAAITPVGAAAGDFEPAPSLAGTDPITGKQVSLADFAGKPVVINLWADWCPGCRAEAPALKQLAAEHPEAAVLGIDVRDTRDGARSFYREFGWEHPTIFDADGKLANSLGLFGMPTTIFLNADHEIVATIVGETNLEGFESGLEAAKAAS